jgi:hypothetical protein
MDESLPSSLVLRGARGNRKVGADLGTSETTAPACLSSWLPLARSPYSTWMAMHDGEEIDGPGFKWRLLGRAARLRKIWALCGLPGLANFRVGNAVLWTRTVSVAEFGR